MKKALPALSVGLLLLFLLLSPKKTFASFPQVAGGPGLILSDSPFYAFDKLYQKGKLFLAFSPQKRAEVRNSIMGERMAEIKIAYDRGDKTAMGLALIELTEEGRKIESDLKIAREDGVDVSAQAKTISDSLRFYRQVLSEASMASDYDVSLSLESGRESLLASKIVIEDFLRPEDLVNAIQNDTDDEGETAVLGIATRIEKIEKILGSLEKKADTEDLLEEKKLVLGEQTGEERTIREKKRKLIEKRRKLIAERKKRLSETRDALKRAREAARGFVETRQEEKNLQSTPGN